LQFFQLAFGHIIAHDRRIVENVKNFHGKRWDKGAYAESKGLKWSTLGLIGLGHIGKAVAQRARGFEMNVLAFSPRLTDEEARACGVGRASDMLEVASCSDFVVVVCRGGEETKGLIGAEFLNSMTKGAVLVNVARGLFVCG
jgi:D-3-phosphoglycerate dehydrogenase